MDMGKEKIKTKGCKFLLVACQYVGISKHNKSSKLEAYSSSDITRVKYTTYRHSMAEKNYSSKYNMESVLYH
jgi:hypothetical protein